MRRNATVMLVVALALLGSVVSTGGQPGNRVDRVSNTDFAQTVQRVETALKSKGMMIVATIDHQNMMRMVGGSIKGSKTFEFGKPDMLKMVMPVELAAGLELPHKIYVYERADGKAVVSYYKQSTGFGAYGKDQLKMVGGMVDKMLDEIVAEATK